MRKNSCLLFSASCLAWFAIMAALAAFGPVGRSPHLSMALFLAAFLLSLAMFRLFPEKIGARNAFAMIVGIGVFVRILFVFCARYPTEVPVGFKAVLAAADTALILALLAIVVFRDLPPRRLLLYAANPIPVVFVCGEGHMVVFLALLLTLAVWSFEKRKEGLGFFMVGLAAALQPFAAVAIPFVLNSRNWKKSFAFLVPFVLCPAFGGFCRGLPSSDFVWRVDMHFNDSALALLRLFFGDAYATVAAALFCTWALVVYMAEHDRIRSLYLMIGGGLLLLPVLQPWHLVLICPFLVLFPSRAWLYLCAASALAFPALGVQWQIGVLHDIGWLKGIEFVPFFTLLIYGSFRDGLLERDHSFDRPGSVSVVVPALNEIENIGACIDSIEKSDPCRTVLREIVVSDGGSSDGTMEEAKRLGAVAVRSEKGRGVQVKKAIEHVSGDIVVVLHADCRLKPGTLGAVVDALAKRSGSPGGAFSMSFEVRTPASRMIAFLNNFRARFFGIAFGDQAQFFRMDALSKAGGYPAFKLMEDVELSFRLKTIGSPVFIPSGVRVSNRRWNRDGITGNAFLIVTIFFRYVLARRFFGIEPGDDEEYYRRYYTPTT